MSTKSNQQFYFDVMYTSTVPYKHLKIIIKSGRFSNIIVYTSLYLKANQRFKIHKKQPNLKLFSNHTNQPTLILLVIFIFQAGS